MVNSDLASIRRKKCTDMAILAAHAGRTIHNFKELDTMIATFMHRGTQVNGGIITVTATTVLATITASTTVPATIKCVATTVGDMATSR